MAFFYNYSFLGIDLGSRLIKVVQLKKGKKGIFLYHYGCTDTPEGTICNGKVMEPEIIADCLKTLLIKKHYRGNRAVISISGENVILRKLVLPKMTGKELAGAVRFEVEKNIALPLEDIIYDYFYLCDKSAGKIGVLLVAVHREIISKYMKVMEKANLYPAAIEIDALALARSFNFYLKKKKIEVNKDKCFILLDIGAETSKMIILEGENYSFSRTLPLGGNHFTRRVMEAEKLPQVKAEKKKYEPNFLNLPRAREAAADLVREIQRTIDYFQYNMDDREVHLTDVFFTGGTSGICQLDSYLSSELKVEARLLDSIQFFKYKPDKSFLDINRDKKFLNLAAGLALRRWDHA